jgi:hypothetical protein
MLYAIINGSSINHGSIIMLKIYKSKKASQTAMVKASEKN